MNEKFSGTTITGKCGVRAYVVFSLFCTSALQPKAIKCTFVFDVTQLFSNFFFKTEIIETNVFCSIVAMVVM